jgi:hypothetical protein
MDLTTTPQITATEHWARKGDVRLFLWRKRARAAPAGTILFVHGSSMASQPTFAPRSAGCLPRPRRAPRSPPPASR